MSCYTWTRVTGDGVVCNTPVRIGTVMLTGDGNGHADITLYDGESTGDPPIAAIKTLQYRSGSNNFSPPLETRRGLYVDVGSNVQSVLILYEVI